MKLIFCLLLFTSVSFAQTAASVPSVQPADAHSNSAIKTPTPREIAHMEEMLQDWPDFARYRAANAALPAPAPGENRVVFMGDSITDSWGHGDEFFPGKPYVNRGISGQTTPQMLVRFRADVIDLKPKVVVILAGTNDIAGNTGPSTPEMIEDNLTSMAELGRVNGIRIVLSSILPAADYPWKPDIDPVDEILLLNGWMQNYCARTGCVYLDYYSHLVNPERGMKSNLTIDGVHPNAAGYRVMDPLAEAAIAEALQPK